MNVEFQDNKLQEFCEDFKKLKKRYGQIQTQEIIKRINELSSAESLFDISKLPQARLHPLKQNLQGFLAVDLKHPYRLILLPIDGEIQNYKSITKIKIIKMLKNSMNKLKIGLMNLKKIMEKKMIKESNLEFKFGIT